MGTGTEEMTRRCIAKGLQKPKFIQEIDFKTIIYRSKSAEIEKGTEKGTEKISKNQQLMLKAISQNPHITSGELSAIIGIRADKIRVNLSKLKTKGFIERVGPDKGGYWKVASFLILML